MSDAQEKNPVKQHFESGKLPRLDATMLPRDPNRALGTLRSVVCKSFNYCKQYPSKLDLFIEVLTFAVLFAKQYKAKDVERRKAAEVARAKEAEAIKRKEELAKAQAQVNESKDLKVAKIENGVAYNAAGEELGPVEGGSVNG